MTPDIWRKIQSDFVSEASLAESEINELDAKTKGLIEDRLLRCIIHLADGNLQMLKDVITLSSTDYRDVIWQAEYECTDEQKRDLSKPFK